MPFIKKEASELYTLTRTELFNARDCIKGKGKMKAFFLLIERDSLRYKCYMKCVSLIDGCAALKKSENM